MGNLGTCALVLISLCCACGESGNEGGVDASVVEQDGGLPDAATEPGMITLVAAPGEEFAFHRADGSLIEVVTTDESGRFEYVVAPNSMVSTERNTWMAVNPGDTIRTLLGMRTERAEITVTVPGETFPEADTYRVLTGCSGTVFTPGVDTTVTVTPDDRCTTEGTADVVVLALTGPVPLAFVAAADIDITGATASIDLSSPWSTTWQTVTVEVTALPDEDMATGSLSVSHPSGQAGSLPMIGGGQRVITNETFPLTVQYQVVPGVGDGFEVRVSGNWFTSEPRIYTQNSVVRRFAPASGTSVDLSVYPSPLPVTLSISSGVEEIRPQVAWDLGSAPPTVSYVEIGAFWNGNGVEGHSLIAPSPPPSPVTFPELPVEWGHEPFETWYEVELKQVQLDGANYSDVLANRHYAARQSLGLRSALRF